MRRAVRFRALYGFSCAALRDIFVPLIYDAAVFQMMVSLLVI